MAMDKCDNKVIVGLGTRVGYDHQGDKTGFGKIIWLLAHHTIQSLTRYQNNDPLQFDLGNYIVIVNYSALEQTNGVWDWVSRIKGGISVVLHWVHSHGSPLGHWLT